MEHSYNVLSRVPSFFRSRYEWVHIVAQRDIITNARDWTEYIVETQDGVMYRTTEVYFPPTP